MEFFKVDPVSERLRSVMSVPAQTQNSGSSVTAGSLNLWSFSTCRTFLVCVCVCVCVCEAA